MLQGVAFPPAGTARRHGIKTAARKIVVSKRARPHDIGTSLVVFRFGNCHRSLVDERTNKARSNVIGNLGRPCAAEEPFAYVGNHVGYTRCRLIRRQGKCKFRV